jgi:glycosyltransferase
LNDPNYEIRIFTGPQKLKVAEVMGFTVVPIMENQVVQGFSYNASKMGFQL